MKALALPVCLLLVCVAGVHSESAAPGPAHGLNIRSAAELQGAADPGFDAREVLVALAQAFDDRASSARQVGGEWTIEVDGRRFFWAGGRLLPEEALANAERYDPYPFYRYEPGPPRHPTYSEAEKRALDQLVEERDREPQRRHPAFMNALWRITDEDSAYRRQKTTFFLGLRTLIHRELLEDLAAVEEEILELAAEDRELSAFIAQLRSIEGYNYRRVDRTALLSNHSYGIAVDLLPAYYGGRQVYWRWAYDSGLEWHSLSERDRFHIPMTIVDAFERHGFVWGGKWRFFDVIHFEYRPEILILNGLDVNLH